MSKISYLLIFLLFLSSISCSVRKAALPEDYSTKPLELPLEVLSVKIIDGRSTPLKPMNWDLPKIGIKKQNWVGNPPLSQINKKDIESIIRNASKTGGIGANFEFTVLEGECSIALDWKSATEFSTFKGELFVDIPDDNLSFNSNAELRYTSPTWNATEEHTLELYNITVRNVTHSILKQMKDGFEAK